MAVPDLSVLAAQFRALGLSVLAEAHRLTIAAPDDTLVETTVRGGFVTLEVKCGAISLARKLVSVNDPKAVNSIRAFVTAHALREDPEVPRAV